MAINSISFYNNFFEKNVEFLCDFSSDDDRDRIVSELGPETKVSTLQLPKFERGSSIISSLFNRFGWIQEVTHTVGEQNPLAILVLGGDDFSEYYSGYKIVIRLYLMYRLSLKFPMYLIGHSIGPFKSWRKKAFSFLMARCRIVTRDLKSLEHCQNDLKHKHSKLGHDLAWFDLPNQTVELKEKVLSTYGLHENEYVVITPSALVKHYTNNELDYFSAWKNLLENIVSKGYCVVLMPHVFNYIKRDDRWAIAEIMKLIPNMDGVYAIDDVLMPAECRAIVSACRFSIACRMHAAVSTLQTGKPSIALSYSVKYAGVIGVDMQLPELVVEASDHLLWESDLTNVVMQKVEYIEDNYEQLTTKIGNRVHEIKEEQSHILKDYGRQMFEGNGGAFVK